MVIQGKSRKFLQILTCDWPQLFLRDVRLFALPMRPLVLCAAERLHSNPEDNNPMTVRDTVSRAQLHFSLGFLR